MSIRASIAGIEYFLPERRLTTEMLALEYPEWSAAKIESKTGIAARSIVSEGMCASDLAFEAATKLFASGLCARDEVDFLLFCTQTPDYFLPTSACLLQDRLRLRRDIGAMDYNLGCSGFVYGLSLATGLISSGQVRTVLLLVADTYSRLLRREDRSVRTIFGDGAAAILVTVASPESPGNVGPFAFGTDGRGADNLIVRGGGFRNLGMRPFLEMDGPEMFAFALDRVPEAVNQLLNRANISVAGIQLFAFHQANRTMLEHLRKKLDIPRDKFPYELSDCGNTVSATIPIVLKRNLDAGKLSPGDRVMAVGFGVGYSWASCLLTIGS